MSRPKKDAKYLNVYIERAIHEEFDEFCTELGQSKTVATERALRLYMDTMRKNMPCVNKKRLERNSSDE